MSNISKAATLAASAAELLSRPGSEAKAINMIWQATKFLSDSGQGKMAGAGSALAAAKQIDGIVKKMSANEKVGIKPSSDALLSAAQNKAGGSSGSMLPPVSTGSQFGSDQVPPEAVGSRSHLLILTSESGGKFYFGLKTAPFDAFKRSTNYNVASQERLQRQEALQSVAQGGETITLSGQIYTTRDAGSGQVSALRAIAEKMSPVSLVTGYGEFLGKWYIVKIDEDQSYLFQDGLPRKQEFTIEFKRYGDDYT